MLDWWRLLPRVRMPVWTLRYRPWKSIRCLPSIERGILRWCRFGLWGPWWSWKEMQQRCSVWQRLNMHQELLLASFCWFFIFEWWRNRIPRGLYGYCSRQTLLLRFIMWQRSEMQPKIEEVLTPRRPYPSETFLGMSDITHFLPRPD